MSLRRSSLPSGSSTMIFAGCFSLATYMLPSGSNVRPSMPELPSVGWMSNTCSRVPAAASRQRRGVVGVAAMVIEELEVRGAAVGLRRVLVGRDGDARLGRTPDQDGGQAPGRSRARHAPQRSNDQATGFPSAFAQGG